MFSNPVHIEATLLKFKMSIKVTSAILPGDEADLWCEPPISFEVDLNDFKSFCQE